jgi:hypothetical protein
VCLPAQNGERDTVQMFDPDGERRHLADYRGTA